MNLIKFFITDRYHQICQMFISKISCVYVKFLRIFSFGHFFFTAAESSTYSLVRSRFDQRLMVNCPVGFRATYLYQKNQWQECLQPSSAILVKVWLGLFLASNHTTYLRNLLLVPGKWLRARLQSNLTTTHHSRWLINYIDTKPKCRHLKKFNCKETLRQVFIRVYKLKIHTVVLEFSTQFCKLLLL